MIDFLSSSFDSTQLFVIIPEFEGAGVGLYFAVSYSFANLSKYWPFPVSSLATMRRECRERFPRYRLQRKPLVNDPGMHHATCVTHVPWCMSEWLISDGGEKYLLQIHKMCPNQCNKNKWCHTFVPSHTSLKDITYIDAWSIRDHYQ